MPEEAIKFSGGEVLQAQSAQRFAIFFSVRMSANFGKSIFLVNYNCDASYDHLWCPNGPEVNQKWVGSGPEVDWKCPSVCPYVCPSQTLPLPP